MRALNVSSYFNSSLLSNQSSYSVNCVYGSVSNEERLSKKSLLFIVLRPAKLLVTVSKIPLKADAAANDPPANEPTENNAANPPDKALANNALTPLLTTPDRAPKATAYTRAS